MSFGGGVVGLFAAMAQGIKDWIATKGIWWMASVVVHTLVLTTALLLMGSVVTKEVHTGVPVFEGQPNTVLSNENLDHFDAGADLHMDPGDSTRTTLTGRRRRRDGRGRAGAAPPRATTNPGAYGTGKATTMASSAHGSGPGGSGGGGTGLMGASLSPFAGGKGLSDVGGDGNGPRSAARGGVRQAGGVGDAVDGVIGSIRGKLEKGDLLVCWLMDESISLLEDRQMVADKVEPFFHEIEARDKKGNFQLYNAVVGFGIQSQELVRPSRFSSDVIKAIRTCPIDTTGKENVMSAVQNVIAHYGSRGWKGMIIVIWTDESGDDIMMLEPTIEMCRKKPTRWWWWSVPRPFWEATAARIIGSTSRRVMPSGCRSRVARIRPCRKRCSCRTGTTPSFRPGARTGRRWPRACPGTAVRTARAAVGDRALGADALGPANRRHVYAVGSQGGPGTLQAQQAEALFPQLRIARRLRFARHSPRRCARRSRRPCRLPTRTRT